MSANKYLPHALILPEDDANRQIAVGFSLDPLIDLRRIQVLPVARGLSGLTHELETVHVEEIRRNPDRRIVLLADFDSQVGRPDHIKNSVPAGFRDRVFVLGPVR